MLVSAWLMVLFHTWLFSEPATWMPMPAPSITLEAMMSPRETSVKIAMGTLTKWEATIWESMTPSSNQMPASLLLSHEEASEWSVSDWE